MDPDIKVALRSADLSDYFSGLPPFHQREYTKWILEAKKRETKEKRIAKMIAILQAKRSSS